MGPFRTDERWKHAQRLRTGCIGGTNAAAHVSSAASRTTKGPCHAGDRCPRETLRSSSVHLLHDTCRYDQVRDRNDIPLIASTYVLRT